MGGRVCAPRRDESTQNGSTTSDNNLSRSGWSQRRIARAWGLNRETVAKYRQATRIEAETKSALVPTASAPTLEAKPALVPAGSGLGRKRQCEPFQAPIVAGLEAGWSARRIYQDLVNDHQFRGGYDAVSCWIGAGGWAGARVPGRRTSIKIAGRKVCAFCKDGWLGRKNTRPPNSTRRVNGRWPTAAGTGANSTGGWPDRPPRNRFPSSPSIRASAI